MSVVNRTLHEDLGSRRNIVSRENAQAAKDRVPDLEKLVGEYAKRVSSLGSQARSGGGLSFAWNETIGRSDRHVDQTGIAQSQ